MNKIFGYKKSILCIIIAVVIILCIISSNVIFAKDYSKINNLDDLKTSRKRIILTSCTHWGGIESDGNAADDIEDWLKSIKNLNPDYLLHLGDITESGKLEEFIQAYENFSDIINTTNIDQVWSIAGGAHDGLVGYIPIENYFSFSPICKSFIEKFKLTKTGEKIYNLISFYTQWFREKFKLGYFQVLEQTSQWYTLKIGNNVFVMVGYFNQPWTWSSGLYGNCSEGNLLNMNKVNWLNNTLAKWNGTGNNIFICHHFPLHHTNIYTDEWAGMDDSRFVYESELILDILSRYTDIVAWFSGHVHVDSNATFSSNSKVSKGTAVSGASRPDLPDHIHFICCGNIWKEHGMAWDSEKNGFANFRYFDLNDGLNYVDLMAWDSTNNKLATMTVNDTDFEVEKYRINLPYPVGDSSNPIFYEQAWDVYDYCELKYKWYQDNEGLRRNKDGWIESRWDFWGERNFSNAKLFIDTSDPDALNNKIYYSLDCMKTWSTNWYNSDNLTNMPSARWVKVTTDISTKNEVFIRDIQFEFL